MKYIMIIVIFVNFLFCACEKNPIGEDEIDAPNRVLRGNVVLDQSTINPEGVFVWLDGFDMHVYTDSEGKFEFFLPPPAAQATPKGVSGAFDIFYYVANYKLASTRVYTQNGNFIYSNGDINSDGVVTPPKTLFRKLETLVYIEPQSAFSDSITVFGTKTDFSLKVDVALRTFKDSVIVFYPSHYLNTSGPLMFRNIETDEVKVLSSTVFDFAASPYDTIFTRPVIRTMSVPIFPDELGKGTFEVIPFIRIEDPNLPEGIKRELELGYIEPGEEYLKVPYIYSGNNRFFTLQ